MSEEMWFIYDENCNEFFKFDTEVGAKNYFRTLVNITNFEAAETGEYSLPAGLYFGKILKSATLIKFKPDTNVDENPYNDYRYLVVVDEPSGNSGELENPVGR